MADTETIGLFGRLKEAPRRADGKNRPPLRRKQRNGEQVTQRIMAIKQQLELLLNSRKGASASTPDFGLTDFNDASISSSDMVSTIVEDIRCTIARYEPRVVIEHIACSPNQDMPLAFDFRITGHILAGDRDEQVEIDMVLNGLNRHYTVV
jgi:type VI secretion system protein